MAETGLDHRLPNKIPFHQLLDKMPAGVYTCDPEGLITYFNRQAELLWGRTPALHDPIDRFCGSCKLFAPDGTPIEHDECWTARALRTGKDCSDEKIILERPDGMRITVSAHANPLFDDAGQLSGAVNVLIDMSDQDRAEEAQAQLREADKRKDEFLATLAHELRNPLAPISNSLHILRLSGELGPTGESMRGIMERQLNHLTRLVDDLMEVSRITRGRIELRKEIVDLTSIIMTAVETCRPLIEAAGHQFAVTLHKQPLTLDADPVRLTQVISNLLNNAAKYTPRGGQIWLALKFENGEAVISVKDTGTGITPDMLAQVFDMFAQVDRTLNRSQGGLGIGLTLAKTFVEMHGGRIAARSEGLNRGSEFIVTLPVVTPLTDSIRNFPDASDNNGSTPIPVHRILIVDDLHSSAYTLSKLLETLGQQVCMTNDPSSAMQEVESKNPDIVISDIAMPDLDGYELAQLIREKGHLGMVLVALTGYGQSSDRARALAAGFDYHLVKPVSLDELRQLLKSLPAPERLSSTRVSK